MKNLLNKFRKNNKGFTLVELIIVIAIIAVLAAVLAPQYIKYVEQSRVSADKSTLSELANAIKVTAVDPSYTFDFTTNNTVKIGTDGTITSSIKGMDNSGVSVNFIDVLKNTLGTEKASIKSSVAKGTEITFTIDATSYAVSCNANETIWDGTGASSGTT